MFSFGGPCTRETSVVGVGEGDRTTERPLLYNHISVDIPDNEFKTNEFEQNFKA
jgi:hypothetical protein